MTEKIIFLLVARQQDKWYKAFLQTANFTLHKHKMQYIRPGHTNPLTKFLGLRRTKCVWNQAGYGCLHPLDWLWILQVAEHFYDFCCSWYAASAPLLSESRAWANAVYANQVLQDMPVCPGNTYSLEGQVTVLDILLWGTVKPFPMSIFSLDWKFSQVK